ncbi:SRP72 RNA-binding domain-containing protein [Tanacetum coccineum]
MFVVHSRDIRRSTQNNGISTPGENEEIYYGQLEEILEFAYTPFKIVLFRVKWFDTRNDGRRVKRIVTRNNITQIMTTTASYKDQPYILATQAKLDEVVIEDDSSSNLALCANLNEFNYANLNIARHSTEVEAPPPPVIHVVDDDDFIDEEDDVPYDLAHSGDEVRANHDVDDEVDTMTSVVRGHGGDGGGNTSKRGVTGNYELKKVVEKYGLQEIEFEWKDQKTMRHVGDNSSSFGNYIGELVSGFPYHYPSWRDIDATDKAHIYPNLQHHFKIDPHLAGPQGEDIKRGIEDYFSKRRERPKEVTPDNWKKLVDFWIDPKRAHRAEVNSRNRRANKIVSLQGSRSLAQSRHQYFQNNNELYPSLIQSYYDLHMKKDVWRDDGSKELYEEMLRLQALGTMTEREILAQIARRRHSILLSARRPEEVTQQEATQKQDEKFQLMVEFLAQTQAGFGEDMSSLKVLPEARTYRSDMSSPKPRRPGS